MNSIYGYFVQINSFGAEREQGRAVALEKQRIKQNKREKKKKRKGELRLRLSV